MTDTKNVRQSNFELLRIISMILIIAYHFGVNQSYPYEEITKSNKIFIELLKVGGKIGNNIFILISGYFLITVKNIKLNKIIKIWLQIFTYSMGIFLISHLIDISFTDNHLTVCFSLNGLSKINGLKLLYSLFPIGFNQWWFASTYFMLLVLSPYINKALVNMTKKEYRNMLILLLVLWSIAPSIASCITNAAVNYGSNALFWFITVYSVGSYIRLHRNENNISGMKYIVVAITTAVIWFLFITITIPEKSVLSFFNVFKKIGFFRNEFIPVFIVASLLFIGFMKMDIGRNRFINFIAGTVFGVYLIHDNRYIAKVLWKLVFSNAQFCKSKFFPLYAVSIILIIFVVCSLIEMLRKQILERIYARKINELATQLERKLGE